MTEINTYEYIVKLEILTLIMPERQNRLTTGYALPWSYLSWGLRFDLSLTWT